MDSKIIKRYSERDSVFFRLKSKRKLGEVLHASASSLSRLAKAPDEERYTDFQQSKKNSLEKRNISAPKHHLKRIQKRISELLMRIQPHEYIFAPVKGRSYVDNAGRHVKAREIINLDIENFYPNCTGNRVIWFFNKRMECSIDVAKILKDIVTKDDCLPQGSPCSPILAYFCYIEMWEEIAEVVNNAGYVLSVYADDITISSEKPGISHDIIQQVKNILKKYGHNSKKSKEKKISTKKGGEVTGVLIKNRSMNIPNRQFKKIHDTEKEIAKCKAPEEKAKLKLELQGRKTQKTQIDSMNQSIKEEQAKT